MDIEYFNTLDEVWIDYNAENNGSHITEKEWKELVYFIHHNTEWSDLD